MRSGLAGQHERYNVAAKYDAIKSRNPTGSGKRLSAEGAECNIRWALDSLQHVKGNE